MLSKFYRFNQIHQTSRSGGFLFLLLLLVSIHGKAQAPKAGDDLPKDERGKYLYYEIVEKSPAAADSLMTRALAFLQLNKLTGTQQKANGVNASGKLVINKTAFVLSHPSGEVKYNFTFEIKEGKYRFWLTDFIFIPYKRDRYGDFVPSTTKGTALETAPGKLNAGEWASYVEATNKHASAFAAEFKDYLSAVPKIKKPNETPKTISTKSW